MILKKVHELRQAGCQAEVNLNTLVNARGRDEKQEKRCRRRAEYDLDGKLLCEQHVAKELIELHLEKT